MKGAIYLRTELINLIPLCVSYTYLKIIKYGRNRAKNRAGLGLFLYTF